MRANLVCGYLLLKMPIEDAYPYYQCRAYPRYKEIDDPAPEAILQRGMPVLSECIPHLRLCPDASIHILYE